MLWVRVPFFELFFRESHNRQCNSKVSRDDILGVRITVSSTDFDSVGGSSILSPPANILGISSIGRAAGSEPAGQRFETFIPSHRRIQQNKKRIIIFHSKKSLNGSSPLKVMCRDIWVSNLAARVAGCKPVTFETSLVRVQPGPPSRK